MYISPTGSGNFSGADWQNAAPIGSLEQMVKAAGPGGTVLLQANAGAYNMTGSVTISSGGTVDAPVTIKGVNSDGTEANITINGTRPETWDPLNPSGNEIFRLSGNASNLVFENMEFNNVKNAFHVISDQSNITVKDMTADNVERFFEDLAGGRYKTASIDGLKIQNVDVTGFSRGVVRLQYDTKHVVIDDVNGNSGRLDGGNFAIGVHLDGTVHDVVIKNSSMGNITDTTSYYWNGDGFATEGQVYNVMFENTRAYGNTDAGYDLKSSSTVLVDAVAEDNKKNFRLWGDETLINVTSKNPQMRGGSGEQLHVQVMSTATAKIIGGTFTDASNGTTVIKVEGGSLDISKSAIVHAAGARVINIANPLAVVTSSDLQVAHVSGVIGASVGWEPGRVIYGTADANVLATSTGGSEVFYGTKAVDTFLFDTASGASLGVDTLRNFGAEDRIVTTSQFVDRDPGTQITADKSDQFVTLDNGANIKVFGENGKAISKLNLVETIKIDDSVKFVYAVINPTGDNAITKVILHDGYDLADAVRAKLAALADAVTSPDLTKAPAIDSPHPTTVPPVVPEVIVDPVTSVTPPEPAKTIIYDVAPTTAIVSTAHSEKFVGTASKDTFFFDTASGSKFGADTIRNFSTGDRIVTTSKIFDWNDDGKIKADKSDWLHLPTDDPTGDFISGTVKIFNQNNKAVSNITLVGTQVEHGHTYYIYGTLGDPSSTDHLSFASHVVDTGLLI